MADNKSKLTIEDYKSDFIFKKKENGLNIQFNGAIPKSVRERAAIKPAAPEPTIATGTDISKLISLDSITVMKSRH